MAKKQPSLKELTKTWYKKLEDSGFKDIETDTGDLRRSSWTFANKAFLRDYKQKQEYFELANTFLNEYEFQNSLDKITWEYHCNGISVRDIGEIFKKVKIKTNRTTIWLTVKRLREIMNRMYLSV